MYEILIIGGGPAGLTAAIYASRAGVKPLVLESLTCGGQVITTSEIENYPAIPRLKAGAVPMNCAARRRRLARRSARSG